MKLTKKKLDTKQLVDHLEEKGVQFNIMSKSQAIQFIEKHNYYYKVAAFRKNFKQINGQYIDLDFAYLKDLATIDAYIREVLLDISINVEHFIKTELSRQLNLNPNVNGYDIVQEFRHSHPEYYNKTLSDFKKTRYQKDMYHKRKDKIPYWVLLEHMNFGCLIKFVEFYYQKYGKKKNTLTKAVKLGNFARHIRNACAHNTVFTINVFSTDNRLQKVSAEIMTLATEIGLQPYKNYKKVNDALALFALAKTYCSPAVIEHQKKELYQLLERCRRFEEHYKNNENLSDMFKIFQKLVDFL